MCLKAAYEAFLFARNNDRKGICAKVKVQILQELVLTRNGFNARLEIENSGDSPMENLQVGSSVSD